MARVTHTAVPTDRPPMEFTLVLSEKEMTALESLMWDAPFGKTEYPEREGVLSTLYGNVTEAMESAEVSYHPSSR